MGTYKNDYNKNDDHMMWELHEIRHKIYEKYKNKSFKERNKHGLELYNKWFKQPKVVKKAS